MKSSLQRKIAWVLLLVLLTLGGVHAAIHWGVIYPSFLALEERAARRDLDRLRNALDRELLYLDTTCKDWAFWDDTYRFVQERSRDYIDSNLGNDTFTTNRLNLLALLDQNGAIVWNAERHWTDSAPLSFAPLPLTAVARQLRSDRVPREQGVSGILPTSAGPLLLAARPILPSLATSPPRGTLIMGRLLDETFLAGMRDQTRIDFRLLSPTEGEGIILLKRLTNHNLPLLDAIDDQTLTATTRFDDLFGQPAFLLQAKLPRDISSYGGRATSFALYFVWGTAIAVFAALSLLLRMIILKPLGQLTHLAGEIRDEGDLSRRLNMTRRDEIGTMALAFDRMLAEIEEQTKSLERANAELIEDTRRRQAAEEALRNLDRMKNEFISAAAHELNTPLAAIMGYAEFLATPDEFGGFSPEQQHEFIKEILTRCEALDRVVSDLLDVSHFESGQAIYLKRRDVDPKELVDRTVRWFQHLAPDHGFVVENTTALPPTIFLDEYRIVQVLENLLSNAVKYSLPGRPITIRLAADETALALEIVDNGIGMTPEQLARVFEKFYRADASNTAVRGLGLGMSIVKRIVEAHGGTITIVSTPGEGTTVVVTLPLSPPEE